MLRLPAALSEAISQLTRLPGIGPKAAERLVLALAAWEEAEVGALSAALSAVAEHVTPCPECGCLAQDGERCSICTDPVRERTSICVVEGPLDAVALERGDEYNGLYHVLGGALSPVKGVLPEDLRIDSLMERARELGATEIIIATNASPDGEATALYLKQELTAQAAETSAPLRITRLARGLPSGGQLDYTDTDTLASALRHRTEL